MKNIHLVMLFPFSRERLPINEAEYTEIAPPCVGTVQFLFLGSIELVQVNEVMEF